MAHPAIQILQMLKSVTGGGPSVRIQRSTLRASADLAVCLYFDGGMVDAHVWLSAADARQLGTALIEHADAYEAEAPAMGDAA